MDIFDVLKKLNINYDLVEHEPVFTVEEAKSIKSKIEGIGCKNIFLTDRKDNYYLVIVEEDKRINISQISKLVNTSRLEFASTESLKKILNLEIGSVTPFGIINDKENKVIIIIDECLINKKLLFHPNTNSKTINVEYNDLIKFIENQKHTYKFMK